jgi:DNA-binding NtrC family response regulator
MVYNQRLNMRVQGLSPEASPFCEPDGRGNVRELFNLVERLVVLGREGVVEPVDLALAVGGI